MIIRNLVVDGHIDRGVLAISALDFTQRFAYWTSSDYSQFAERIS